MFLIVLCLPKFTCLNPMALSLRSNTCSCCCELNLPQWTAPWISTCLFFVVVESPVQVWCIMLDAWGWCTGTTQGVGMGREEGGGFRMGNTCIPVVDSFWYMAKPMQCCGVEKKKKSTCLFNSDFCNFVLKEVTRSFRNMGRPWGEIYLVGSILGTFKVSHNVDRLFYLSIRWSLC